MKNTGRMALCGIITGMGAAVMLLSALLPSMTYALPMLAGGLLIIPAIEFGSRTAFTTYAATALLSLILPADKEAAFMYVLLFGLYPIIKKYFEQLRSRRLEYVLKFLYFNAAVIGAVWLASRLLGIPVDDGSLGRWTIPVLLAAGNAAFLIYDITLTRFIPMYAARLQPILHKTFHI